ncbi:MAG: hypothetical protein ABIZ56_05330 [Chthoniobacteraceae bacterium]
MLRVHRMSPISLMQSAPGPETIIDGVRYLYFAGTSYLGLAAHHCLRGGDGAACGRAGRHMSPSRCR